MMQEPTLITSYDDLKAAKQFLKEEVNEQETSFENNPIFKISSSLFLKKESLKNSLASISSDNYLKTIENLISTILLANKKTRGVFIGYVVAKETIPYAIQKVSEILNQKKR